MNNVDVNQVFALTAARPCLGRVLKTFRKSVCQSHDRLEGVGDGLSWDGV